MYYFKCFLNRVRLRFDLMNSLMTSHALQEVFSNCEIVNVIIKIGGTDIGDLTKFMVNYGKIMVKQD